MRLTKDQKIPMSIRVPQSTHRKLLELAPRYGETPSGIAQKAVEQFVRNPPPAEEEETSP